LKEKGGMAAVGVYPVNGPCF